MSKQKLSPSNYKNLQTELSKWYKKRNQVIEELRLAYEFGDLRENSEFDSAKMAEHLCNEQIKKLEHLLNTGIIIENQKKNTIDIGSIVTIEYLDDLSKETFEIVTALEVSIIKNKISSSSPMGKALIGKKKGEILTIDSPTGLYKIKIIDINYL
ncbi:MAG: transcription elongation factor GreA [Bacilli bacterium]|jgi:transcription elongation factor GreA|nr:transcription elongation factor GreA [Bacilli bacterium]